jgi:hypothetical protein
VIDEDLGKSGAGGVDRHGFQKLIVRAGGPRRPGAGSD